ncbi:DsbA family protein [Kutzneria kofuensis]|uniref:Protein-disulfide isomerase n=1 Tax=Kutzneria kofuensis TaxID=103725 RepID=A0A7W9NFV2_9PSEU|nr:thioredoxin domain-containing protein [Kutzneria kofuensis]MBB5890511.1 protein-disulfide isomerase [Kutzneria kofuensis]
MGAIRTRDAVAAARSTADGRRNLILVVAVAVIAAVVIGGVVFTHAMADRPQAGGTYATTVQSDGTVVAGSATAKATLDVYEDFLCPYCKHNLEDPYGKAITKAIADGSLRVNYHVLDLLDNETTPAGYSLRAGNAALAAAKAGRFAEFHSALYDQQPTEGQAGYTNDELVDIGRKAGITGQQFADEVKAGAFDSEIRNQTDKARDSVNFKGTPTVLSGNTQVDISKAGWLTQLTGAA